MNECIYITIYIIYIHIDLSVMLHSTEAVMALHLIYKPLAHKKNIHNCLSDSKNSFLFFSFYFSCMVAITAAVLASTLVNGFQHNQIHVTEIYL